MKIQTGILGGGISGVCLASRLDHCEVLEKAPRIGGLSGSIHDQGFTFDAAGPHIMFSKNKGVLDHMVEVLGENVHQRRRENKIWFKGRLVKYPFENGLSDLPKEDCFECILGYLQNPWTKPPENLEEWSYATFGSGISEKYFLPYNRKIWNHDPARICLEWVERIPKPPLEDVLKSAVGIPTEGYLHQLHFYYPKRGGYEALVHAFAARAKGPVQTDCEVLRISGRPGAWQVETGRGVRTYETLVSTLPVHELAKVWEDFPLAGREALAGLRYNSLVNVLLGFREERGLPYTALYVPDPDIPFHRLSWMNNFSSSNAPNGCTGLMAEITCDPDGAEWNMPDEHRIRETLHHLEQMGLVDPSTMVYSKVVRFSYGYPVYDLDYFERVRILREALRATGLRILGRFAEFDYINSDVCVERALAMARELQADPS